MSRELICTVYVKVDERQGRDRVSKVGILNEHKYWSNKKSGGLGR